MDSFLRRVLAARELEQEVAIIAVPPEALRAPHCEGCGVALSMSEDLSDLTRRFCTPCGGRKADARRDRELAAAAAKTAIVEELLSIAGVPVADRKTCARCGKTLRSDNKKGVCSQRCQANGAGDESPPRSSKGSAATFAQTRKRFRVVSDALGIDGEDLLRHFMEGWLQKVRGSVQRPEDLDDDPL